jgi:hypothetical protein
MNGLSLGCAVFASKFFSLRSKQKRSACVLLVFCLCFHCGSKTIKIIFGFFHFHFFASNQRENRAFFSLCIASKSSNFASCFPVLLLSEKNKALRFLFPLFLHLFASDINVSPVCEQSKKTISYPFIIHRCTYAEQYPQYEPRRRHDNNPKFERLIDSPCEITVEQKVCMHMHKNAYTFSYAVTYPFRVALKGAQV